MTDPTTLAFMPIEELAPKLKSGAVSPVAVVDAVLARIEGFEPRLNAFITVLADSARAEAKRAEAELAAGQWRGPLHGVPITLKDLYDTKGVRTTGAGERCRDRVPDRDCPVWTRLQAAGAVCVGKTNMYEYAFGHVSPAFGPTRNPYNLERTTSGSSSGSGAAVAMGLGQGSMGSDTGGSIRGPAGYCNLAGIKPTYGRVPRTAVMPLSWSLDHCGPMTRTVWDCAAMLQVVAGYDPADPGSANLPVPDYLADIDGGVTNLRLGLPKNHLADLPASIAATLDNAIDVFRRLGATVTELTLPNAFDLTLTNMVIISAEAASIHENWYLERPTDYSAPVRQRIEAGLSMTAPDLIRAQRARRVLIERLRAAMADVDLLLLPTAAIEPPTLVEQMAALPMGDGWETFLTRNRFNSPYNLTGLPAMSIPGGFTTDGLPLGIQLVGHAWSEPLVFRAARAFERATEFWRRRPPLD